jgi:hypothetical protein
MRKLRTLCVLASAVGAILMLAGNALASTNAQAARGQCGGQISTWQQYVNNLTVFGAVPQAAKINQSAGYTPRDGSFTQWLKERVVVTRLAAPATITNYGCNANGVFPAGKKYLTKGWPVLVALPGKYSKSDIRMSPSRVCSTVTYVNVCGTQVVYNGDQDHLQSWINSYIADHCAPTVTTTVTCNVAGASNFGKAGQCEFPPPSCQFGGTFPNCSPPPCSVTNTCPPSTVSIPGTTSVSSTRTAACPPPNSSIVKTGTSTLASPTFTGTGTSQAAAQASLDSQLATWRAQNQATVDTQAQNAANAQLSSCPAAPPVVVTHFTNVTCTGFEEIFGGESMIIKCDVSNDNGAPISLDAHSNDGNSRVSGINCYSQGGTPSCQGNGQFEFRVTGINTGTTTLSSSVTVTASSNGVNKTWTSDPFPVDRSF